jgi:hypothetical protein
MIIDMVSKNPWDDNHQDLGSEKHTILSFCVSHRSNIPFPCNTAK